MEKKIYGSIGLACDHAGFKLKEYIRSWLTEEGVRLFPLRERALPPDEVSSRITAKLAWMPAAERAYWRAALAAETDADGAEHDAVARGDRAVQAQG